MRKCSMLHKTPFVEFRVTPFVLDVVFQSSTIYIHARQR